MEEKSREGKSRRMSKDVTGYVQYGLRKNKFAVIFEDDQKKYSSASSLLYVYEKQQVGKEVDSTISDLPKRGQSEFLNINRDPVCEGYGTFGKLMYLYIFYCLFLLNRYYQIL